MRQRRLSRRTVLRGTGAVAIALPWLEAMEGRPQAAPLPGPARRFVGVFQPGGTIRPRYTPTGTETAFTVGPILKPLEPMQSRLVVIDGLDLKCAFGTQHQSGICALLTGTTQQGNGYAGGPSIDQVIATRISEGKKPKGSLQLAVRWATGKSRGLLSPYGSLVFEDAPGAAPVPPRLDPVEIFSSLFGSLVPTDPGAPPDTSAIDRKRSILDYVGRRYAVLSARLGSGDRAKLDQHLTKIREIEQGLSEATLRPGGACHAPVKVDTSDYNPSSGLNAASHVVDVSTDSAIPKVGKYMMDMIVAALACDITAVATLQWTDTEAKHTFPWLMLPEHHHYYQHDGGFHPDECATIATWYASQHCYLLQQMAAVDMGGHSLLDESVVFLGSELQEPPTHVKTNMPLVLAGNGGGLKTGRWLTYNGLPHNNLLVSVLHLFGDMRTSHGDAKYCTGSLTNIA
jgi:hypothetical protein